VHHHQVRLAAAGSRGRMRWLAAVAERGATPAAATDSVNVERQHLSVGSRLDSAAANSVVVVAAVAAGSAGRYAIESVADDQKARTNRQVGSQR